MAVHGVKFPRDTLWSESTVNKLLAAGHDDSCGDLPLPHESVDMRYNRDGGVMRAMGPLRVLRDPNAAFARHSPVEREVPGLSRLAQVDANISFHNRPVSANDRERQRRVRVPTRSMSDGGTGEDEDYSEVVRLRKRQTEWGRLTKHTMRDMHKMREEDAIRELRKRAVKRWLQHLPDPPAGGSAMQREDSMPLSDLSLESRGTEEAPLEGMKPLGLLSWEDSLHHDRPQPEVEMCHNRPREPLELLTATASKLQAFQHAEQHMRRAKPSIEMSRSDLMTTMTDGEESVNQNAAAVIAATRTENVNENHAEVEAEVEVATGQMVDGKYVVTPVVFEFVTTEDEVTQVVVDEHSSAELTFPQLVRSGSGTPGLPMLAREAALPSPLPNSVLDHSDDDRSDNDCNDMWSDSRSGAGSVPQDLDERCDMGLGSPCPDTDSNDGDSNQQQDRSSPSSDGVRERVYGMMEMEPEDLVSNPENEPLWRRREVSKWWMISDSLLTSSAGEELTPKGTPSPPPAEVLKRAMSDGVEGLQRGDVVRTGSLPAVVSLESVAETAKTDSDGMNCDTYRSSEKQSDRIPPSPMNGEDEFMQEMIGNTMHDGMVDCMHPGPVKKLSCFSSEDNDSSRIAAGSLQSSGVRKTAAAKQSDSRRKLEPGDLPAKIWDFANQQSFDNSPISSISEDSTDSRRESQKFHLKYTVPEEHGVVPTEFQLVTMGIQGIRHSAPPGSTEEFFKSLGPHRVAIGGGPPDSLRSKYSQSPVSLNKHLGMSPGLLFHGNEHAVSSGSDFVTGAPVELPEGSWWLPNFCYRVVSESGGSGRASALSPSSPHRNVPQREGAVRSPQARRDCGHYGERQVNSMSAASGPQMWVNPLSNGAPERKWSPTGESGPASMGMYQQRTSMDRGRQVDSRSESLRRRSVDVRSRSSHVNDDDVFPDAWVWSRSAARDLRSWPTEDAADTRTRGIGHASPHPHNNKCCSCGCFGTRILDKFRKPLPESF